MSGQFALARQVAWASKPTTNTSQLLQGQDQKGKGNALCLVNAPGKIGYGGT